MAGVCVLFLQDLLQRVCVSGPGRNVCERNVGDTSGTVVMSNFVPPSEPVGDLRSLDVDQIPDGGVSATRQPGAEATGAPGAAPDPHANSASRDQGRRPDGVCERCLALHLCCKIERADTGADVRQHHAARLPGRRKLANRRSATSSCASVMCAPPSPPLPPACCAVPSDERDEGGNNGNVE